MHTVTNALYHRPHEVKCGHATADRVFDLYLVLMVGVSQRPRVLLASEPLSLPEMAKIRRCCGSVKELLGLGASVRT